jgi:hypothetical protein
LGRRACSEHHYDDAVAKYQQAIALDPKSEVYSADLEAAKADQSRTHSRNRQWPPEYSLHATGWGLVVSGIQSLISVYMDGVTTGWVG